MDVLTENDLHIKGAPLSGKKVAVIGYGSQGHAQALNLKESGVDVMIGLLDGDQGRQAAEKAGFAVGTIEEASWFWYRMNVIKMFLKTVSPPI